jgi:hypothetical protein
MQNIAKTAIALTIAATAFIAATGPSFAKNKGWHQQNQSSTFVPDSVPRDRGPNS